MSSPAPLLLTCDTALAADLRRLGAAAGTSIEVAAPSPQLRPAWLRAPVVLVGPDVLAPTAASAPTRRDRVHVVGRGALPDSVFRAALGIGAESVLELPDADSWLVQMLADTVDGRITAAPLVGVMGGAGGVGSSTFAAALATAAAQSPTSEGTVVLVDGDRLGGGVERIVGLEPVDGVHWGRLTESAGRLGSRSLLDALPSRGRLVVLGWGPGARPDVTPLVVRETMSAARRGTGMVVVDLPRHPDPAAAELLARCDDLVVVAGDTVPAVASCAQLLGQLAAVPRIHLVVRSHRGGILAEDVARALDLALCAVVGHQRGLDEAVGLGLGPLAARRGPLARAVAQTLKTLAPGPAAVRF